MPNLTRDPFHPALKTGGMYGVMYCNNMNDLTITVDGVKLDSTAIINVYTNTVANQPYVVLFNRVNGAIEEKDGGYVCTELHGSILIDGNPTSCGCWKGRRSVNWYKYVDKGAKGW